VGIRGSACTGVAWCLTFRSNRLPSAAREFRLLCGHEGTSEPPASPIAIAEIGAGALTSATSHSTDQKLDRWADWLVRGRDRGATEVQLRRRRKSLAQVRDRVLRDARLRRGEHVVDLGAGTGLLALEARRRVKSSGYVIAVDVSADALSECRRQAEPAGDVAPLACVVGDVTRIPLASQSIDVVMTRSVLIYLADKQTGVRELYRVLKPTGRASIFEPINELSEQVKHQLRASGFYEELQPEWGEIRKFYDAHKEEWGGTLVGWDERELIAWFEAAGFSRIKVSYELTSGVGARKPNKSEVAAGIRGRPNPNQPSYEEVAREVLSHRADDYLERCVQFLLKRGGTRSASASVYLVAWR
jgi:arsenite methyltransferase